MTTPTPTRRPWNALTNRVRSEAHVILDAKPPMVGLSHRAACGVIVSFAPGWQWRKHVNGEPRRECSRCRKARLASEATP